MIKREARKWVREHHDDDVLDEDELVEVFVALFGRPPDQEDFDVGLWDLVCSY